MDLRSGRTNVPNEMCSLSSVMYKYKNVRLCLYIVMLMVPEKSCPYSISRKLLVSLYQK